MENNPILSKWHKSPERDDVKISEVGFVSNETGKQIGVRRKSFETPEGERNYAYKEVANLAEAKQTMNNYRLFRDAGLPVVEFAKIIKKKVHGADEFTIAMEDLTKNGDLEIDEIDLSAAGIIERSPNAYKIIQQIVCALAVIHNNGLYHFHPGTSFAVRSRMPFPGEAERTEKQFVDFKIIDYANFSDITHMVEIEERGIENTPDEDTPRLRIVGSEKTFEGECRRNLARILVSISVTPEERANLEELYLKLRKEGIKTYEMQ